MERSLRIKFMPKRNWIEFNQSNLNNDPQPKSPINQKGKNEVRVQKVKNSKGGKVVTLITGLSLEQPKLALLLKKIKSCLGTGGTIKSDCMEIQGNKVIEVMEILSKEGFQVRRSGG